MIVSFFPPSVNKHFSIFCTTYFPFHFSSLYFQWTQPHFTWQCKKQGIAGRQLCAKSAIITLPFEAMRIFSWKPTDILSVLGSFHLPRPPKCDFWCWWAITGVCICPWFTVFLNITVMQSTTVLGALLGMRNPKRKWGLLCGYLYSKPLQAFLLHLQSKVLNV